LASTERIARALARDARVGDVVCLHGDVGAGKSVLSRAFVRAVTRDPHLEVPSPTFLLQQVYDGHDAAFGPAVHHFDLYRLNGVSETVKLDFPASFRDAVSLIEWAERLEHETPANRLDVYLSIMANDDELERSVERSRPVTVVQGCDEESSRESSRDADDDDADDDVDPAFLDAQPRLVRLEGKGETWPARVDAVAKTLMEHSL
jgi:tRNA threonylcarbamoyl adenosine modification protein YjeE